MGILDDALASVRRGITRSAQAATRALHSLTGAPDLPILAVPAGQAMSIPAVLEQMRSLGAALQAEDGVALFHRMYLHVTELVDAAAAARTFRDVAFMQRLDCVFAGLYVDAFRATDETRSAAWEPLFALRSEPGVEDLQFALAGLNAHINFDLGLALVRTCRQLGCTLETPGVHEDFLAINAILADAVQGVRESYLAGVALQADRAVAPAMDVVNAWSIEKARDEAWLSASVQWTLQNHADLYAGYLTARASMVGLISRQLLARL